jgi:hypothetical protein
MPADSGLQDAVEKGREAFRRSTPDGLDLGGSPRRPEGRIPSDLHPFFRGLLETLPEIGADWATAEREQWLETARNIFGLLYREPNRDRDPIPLRPRDQTTSYPAPEQRSA